MTHFAVTILGSNGAVPAYDRHPTAQYLELYNQGFLIDCGEGTQLQMMRYHIRPSRIHYIFISHLHGDHYYGLIGLITSFNLHGRETPLHIYCPPALEQILSLMLLHSMTTLGFELHFHPTQALSPQLIFDSPTIICKSKCAKFQIQMYDF